MSEINKPENLFHKIAFTEYFINWIEGISEESNIMKNKIYEAYEGELCQLKKK